MKLRPLTLYPDFITSKSFLISFLIQIECLKTVFFLSLSMHKSLTAVFYNLSLISVTSDKLLTQFVCLYIVKQNPEI